MLSQLQKQAAFISGVASDSSRAARGQKRLREMTHAWFQPTPLEERICTNASQLAGLAEADSRHPKTISVV